MSISQKHQIEQFVAESTGQQADASLLLQYLIAIQHQFLFIPAQAVQLLSQQLSVTPAHIYAVIDFYSFLYLDEGIRYRILFSDNITDRFSDNQLLYQQLEQLLADQQVQLAYTSCTGLCDQGPGLLVNGYAINRLDTERIEAIAEQVQQSIPVDQWPKQWFAIEDNIQRKDIQLKASYQAGAALQAVLQSGTSNFLHQLDDAGLRGRGGAGFNTASKWQFCREAESDVRYVVCNADEGEPGTFKDRVLLNSYAHEVIEGMTICARAIGASEGFIYLRGEYRYLLDDLHAVIQQRREQQLLGKDILGQTCFDFDIEIHLGAGAYICGEESSLIESMEGKRGVPRIRPPFPVEKGYRNKPTVVNNVETFWSVNFIAADGFEDFSKKGSEGSGGTRLLSISGDCTTPGIYEYPFGVSIRQILQDCGGKDAQAVQMAGAAGNLVMAKEFDRTMSFEDLATGGSFMVIGPQRNLLDVLQNFAQFFEHESCGFCTPCRVGSRLLAEIIQQFNQGNGSKPALQQIEVIANLMKHGSFCGLGSSAPTAFIDALNNNRELFEQQLTGDDNPVFDLQQAVTDFDRLVAQSKQGV